MKSLKNIFKSKKGSSSVEIIVWFSVIILMFSMIFTLLRELSFNEEIINNQNHTITSEMPVEESMTKEALNIIEGKEPTTQNIVINNIVKDKNEDFLHDFNLNIISDLASTALIGVIGFFIGKLSKKKKLKI